MKKLVMSNDALIRRIKDLEKLAKSNNVFMRINGQDSGVGKWPWVNRRSNAAATE